jgi:hypothetical protein
MSGKLAVAEKMKQPEGFVQISTSFLQPDNRYCFVICTDILQGHKRGAYCLINLTAAVADGDLVLVGEDTRSMAIMYLRQHDGYWACAPQPRSRLQPRILSGLENAVIGKVERIFDV